MTNFRTLATETLARMFARPSQYKKTGDSKWDESKHPRGQPENAGEFVSAKDTSATTKKTKPTKEEREAKSAKKFDELMANKSPSDAEAFRKAKGDGIAIPPAWTDVVYHGHDKDIIAEGRDDKGRKQRAENPEYRQRISDENNARISRDLLPKIGSIRETLRSDAAAGNEEAKVLYLISLTGFRIGGKGDGKAKEQAFGASTLTGDHIKVAGDTVDFDFSGKKGVRQVHSVTDPLVADMLRDVKPGEKLFQTNDAKVRKAWQDKYGGEKVHDIRHVVATEIAQRELSTFIPPPPETAKQRKHIVKTVSERAAETLGNNPSQTLGTYIDPGVWKPLQVHAIEKEFSNPAAKAAALGEIESAHEHPEYRSGIVRESKNKDRIESVIDWAKKRGQQWN